MPLGLKNAPATFQALMNDIFRPHLRQFVLVFFDNILIYNAQLLDHLAHLCVMLQLLQQHQFYAKGSKCAFGAARVEYLDHFISGEGMATNLEKLRTVQEWPLRQSIKQLRGSLGLIGYYRRFIRHYGSLGQPLTALLKKGAFQWTP